MLDKTLDGTIQLSAESAVLEPLITLSAVVAAGPLLQGLKVIFTEGASQAKYLVVHVKHRLDFLINFDVLGLLE